MELCLALAASVAIPSVVALHLRLNQVNIRTLMLFTGRGHNNATADEEDLKHRQCQVEEELQKMRVAFFHARAKFAVHFAFLLFVAMALIFCFDPSWRSFVPLVFWMLIYAYFAIFHSLNLIEASRGWFRVSQIYILSVHLVFFCIGSSFFGELRGSIETTELALLIASERFQAISLTLICCSMFDKQLTVPWCCLEGAFQFGMSIHRFGLAQCLRPSVLCHELSVQFLVIMPIIAIEKLVRSKIEATLETQDESTMVSGFRRILRGVCDGDILLDSSFKILDNGTSLDQLLSYKTGTMVGTNLLNLFHVDDCKRFVHFMSQQSAVTSPTSMPTAFRATLKGKQGTVAMDFFHVPIPQQRLKKGCNHLLAIKQDADQVIPDAPSDAQVPKCYKPLTVPHGRRSIVSSRSSQRSGQKELTMNYSNLQEVTLLLTSHSEMWDIGELHVKFQRRKSMDDLGMPTLRNFTKPTDWERISRKIQHVIDKASLTEKVAFKNPVWFRMPGESNKYLSARDVRLGHVREVVEGKPILLWLNMCDFEFSHRNPATLEGVDETSKGGSESRPSKDP